MTFKMQKIGCQIILDSVEQVLKSAVRYFGDLQPTVLPTQKLKNRISLRIF